MKVNYLATLFLVFLCGISKAQNTTNIGPSGEINKMLDQWHAAAARSDLAAYFSFFTEEAIYMGTDPKERWRKAEFKAYVTPHFKKGHGWDFQDLERHIEVSQNGQIAWFDELLKTHMGICRGSGVLVKTQGHWKLVQYVLSITVPNAKMGAVEKLKKAFDENYIKTLKQKNER